MRAFLCGLYLAYWWRIRFDRTNARSVYSLAMCESGHSNARQLISFLGLFKFSIFFFSESLENNFRKISFNSIDGDFCHWVTVEIIRWASHFFEHETRQFKVFWIEANWKGHRHFAVFFQAFCKSWEQEWLLKILCKNQSLGPVWF